MRLKTVHFLEAVSGPGENSPSQSQPPPNSRPHDYEIVTDAGWVSIWKRGHALPRIVPMTNVRQAEPFELPKTWVAPDFEALDKSRHEAEAKSLADAKAAAKAAAVAKAMAG